MRNGICVAGNLIVDITYPIERWPRQSELTTITDGITRSVGGAVCNVIADLARLDDTLPLEAMGVIGADAEGDFILEELKAYPNIRTDLLKRQGKTSFTAVMSDNGTKARTFFQYRGANALFDESFIDWDSIRAEILHVGYILLLDALDEEDEEYGTRMARLLAHARARGMKTSIDVVSEAGDRFRRLVSPALKYTDYCVINELEAQQTTGVLLRDDRERLHPENMREALAKLLEMGVSVWAVIHCPELSCAMDAEGNYCELPSLALPKNYIKGTVGAGDAFCSGVLYAAWKGRSLSEALELGTCAAAASLGAVGASEGVKSVGEVLGLKETLRRRKKAVMYGAGNIGRGFIGELMSKSDYEVTFIDVAETVVKELQERGEYTVRYVSDEGCEDVRVSNVTAVNGNDMEAAAEAIAEADLAATAVGVNVLGRIVPNLAEGIRRRKARGAEPLNILICENLVHVDKALERMLKAQLSPEEGVWLEENIGLVEASIGRMVPVQTEEMKDGDPLRVCVERYGFLPVDKAGFRGEFPELLHMIPFEPFDFYIKRKLYVHNMGHAVCAYLGTYRKLSYIFESIAVPEIRIVVENAMQESAMALARRYGTDLSELVFHMEDLLGRFSNAALRDTCGRVGRDAKRKLSASDRLIGPVRLCLEEGITPSYIYAGTAGALCVYLEEQGLEPTAENARNALLEVSGLNGKADGKALEDILEFYEMYRAGEGIEEILQKADELKKRSLKNVV